MIRSRRDVLAMLGGIPAVSVVLSKFPQLRPPAPVSKSVLPDYPASLNPRGGPDPGEYRGVFSIKEWMDSHMQFDGTPPGMCSRCGLTEATITEQGLRGKCQGFR